PRRRDGARSHRHRAVGSARLAAELPLVVGAPVGLVHRALAVEMRGAVLCALLLALERLAELALGLLGGGPRLLVGTHAASIGAPRAAGECGSVPPARQWRMRRGGRAATVLGAASVLAAALGVAVVLGVGSSRERPTVEGGVSERVPTDKIGRAHV